MFSWIEQILYCPLHTIDQRFKTNIDLYEVDTYEVTTYEVNIWNIHLSHVCIDLASSVNMYMKEVNIFTY